MADSRIEKWHGWIEGQISNEIHAMHLHRATYQRVREIARENGRLPNSYFWEYLQDTYAATQAVAVRRQVETSRRVRSLGRLLLELSDDPSRVSRAFFVGLWSDDTRAMADEGFDEQFAGSVGTHLDPAIPRADLEDLTDTSESLKAFVEEHVAHSDARPRKGLPSFDDLDAAIDQIGHLLKKYVFLFTAAGLVQLVPVIQHDWEAVFRQPWIRS
jgi:hypothetical protein